MAEVLLKALKPTLLQYIDKAKAAAPAAIAALIVKLQSWLPQTIEKASSGLKAAAARELPAAGPALTTASVQAADWAKVKVAKLL